MQVAHCETVPFRIDRSLRVKSKGFVTAGGQGEKSQQTQRHSIENTYSLMLVPFDNNSEMDYITAISAPSKLGVASMDFLVKQ